MDGRGAPRSAISADRWAPVGRAVVVALAPGPNESGSTAARTREPRLVVDGPVAVCRPWAADCCMSGRTARTTATASSSLTPASGRHGSMPASQQPSDFQKLPMPATMCWSSSASPSVLRRVVLAQAAKVLRLVERPPTRRGPGRGPPGADPPRTRIAVRSSSTGPLNWTTSSSPRRTTSQAERGERGQRWPLGSTLHVPVMRRWEWMTSPPSKRRSRCLPTASTASTLRPARRWASDRGRTGDAASRCRRARARRARRRRAAQRGGWCRPQASPGASAKSCRPRRKPSARRRPASGLTTAGSPSIVASASRRRRPARTAAARASRAGWTSSARPSTAARGRRRGPTAPDVRRPSPGGRRGGVTAAATSASGQRKPAP